MGIFSRITPLGRAIQKCVYVCVWGGGGGVNINGLFYPTNLSKRLQERCVETLSKFATLTARIHTLYH